MLCGVMILIPALLRAGPPPVLEIRPLTGSTFRCLAFPLLVLSFGLVPAIIDAESVLAGISDGKLSLRELATTGRGSPSARP